MTETPTAQPTPPKATVLQTLLGGACLAWVLALLAGAVYAFRLRCEGFGCTGVGIVWFAWACACVPTLGLTFGLSVWLPRGSRLQMALSYSLRLLTVCAVGLLVYWGVTRQH